MPDDEPRKWADGFYTWLSRVADTHDSVRYTVEHRIQDWRRAESVSVGVVLEMLKRPKIFRYQGLPYAGRIGSVAEFLLAAPPSDDELAQPDWPTLVDYLNEMTIMQRTILVACFVDDVDHADVAAAMAISRDAAIVARDSVAKYLAHASHDACL
uniref:hypothetical protein n=1 Tax=Rhodococcus qingshengii TaxID=334542 RepID=UPI001C4E153F|nr:hypothetical protein [Rhodococcus qingshengii]